MASASPVVLVTGANRGIGFEVVRGLLARGARPILAARTGQKARAAASRLEGAFPLALDITAEDSVRRAAETVAENFGRLDVLINNAAILLDHYANLMETPPEILSRTLETNVVGTLRVSQAFAPLLAKSADPRIINVSSGAGQLDGPPQAFAPAYSVSKTALNMLTQQLAAALPGVVVNSVCPGWCRTDMGGAEAPRTAEEGAAGILWAALDAPRELRETFLRDREPLAW